MRSRGLGDVYKSQAIDDLDERAAYVAERRAEYEADVDLERLAADLVLDQVIEADALRDELRRRLADDSLETCDAWRVPVDAHVLGRRMTCRELAGRPHLRLFRTSTAAFDDAAVHEGVVLRPGAARYNLGALCLRFGTPPVDAHPAPREDPSG